MRKRCRRCAVSLLNPPNNVTDFRSFGAPPPVDREIVLAGGDARWRVPEETPVAFIYNGRNYAVMLATPADLADFAIGFSLTERTAASADEIEAVEIHHSAQGVDLRLTIAAPALARLDLRQGRRNLVGRAGCGVCGVENAEIFFEELPRVAGGALRVDEDALLRAARGLAEHQPINARTRTVHAAAFATRSGDILLAREDVGRHNALDKLIGACVRQDAAMGESFVIMSSRCSYEIVEKAARAGVRAVLSLSAPTAFAIRKARQADVALYALAGERVAAIC